MSTKVHDEKGEEEPFDEVDEILENAKAVMHMKRSSERKSRRNINLSDIPENFAHVPAPASARKSDHPGNYSPRPPAMETALPPVIQLPGGAASNRVRYKGAQQRSSVVLTTFRWFRERYMGCISAVDGTSCDMCGCSVVTPVHAPSQTIARQLP